MRKIPKTLIGTLIAAGVIGASISAYAATTTPNSNSSTSTTTSCFHHGQGGWGGPGMMGNFMSTLAKDLNLSTTTLQSDLKAGKSIASIAQAQGVSTTTLITDLENSAKSNLDQAVSSGKMTSTQEQQMLTRLNQQITNLVNGTMPSMPGHGFDHGQRHGNWTPSGTTVSNPPNSSASA